MLLKGRTPTSALAMAAFMRGIFARSASDAVFASTTPSDFPTCPRTTANADRNISIATTPLTHRIRTVITLLLCPAEHRLERLSGRPPSRRIPICVGQPNQPELRHRPGGKGGRRLCLHRLDEER